MKKWKIVLPTLLATSGLTLVSLVGCGNPDTPEEPLIEGQEVDFDELAQDREYGFRFSETFALEKDKVYTAVIDLTKVKHTQECDVIVFACFEPVNTAQDNISIKKIIINNNHLNETLEMEEPEERGWYFGRQGALTMVAEESDKFKINGNVYITFTAKNTTDKLYWGFGNDL